MPSPLTSPKAFSVAKPRSEPEIIATVVGGPKRSAAEASSGRNVIASKASPSRRPKSSAAIRCNWIGPTVETSRGSSTSRIDRTARAWKGQRVDFPALDVAIGLAFVFFVLAITCSGLNEAIASALRWRAQDLERGLWELLRDPEQGTAALEQLKAHPLIEAMLHPHNKATATGS